MTEILYHHLTCKKLTHSRQPASHCVVRLNLRTFFFDASDFLDMFLSFLCKWFSTCKYRNMLGMR